MLLRAQRFQGKDWFGGLQGTWAMEHKQSRRSIKSGLLWLRVEGFEFSIWSRDMGLGFRDLGLGLQLLHNLRKSSHRETKLPAPSHSCQGGIDWVVLMQTK